MHNRRQLYQRLPNRLTMPEGGVQNLSPHACEFSEEES